MNLAEEMKKMKKRQVLSQNKFKGRMAESMFELSERTKGNKVERTGRGHDYKVTKRNPLTGRSRGTEYVEVKSSPTAPLSKLQKKKKKEKSNYRVYRPRF